MHDIANALGMLALGLLLLLLAGLALILWAGFILHAKGLNHQRTAILMIQPVLDRRGGLFGDHAAGMFVEDLVVVLRRQRGQVLALRLALLFAGLLLHVLR